MRMVVLFLLGTLALPCASAGWTLISFSVVTLDGPPTAQETGFTGNVSIHFGKSEEFFSVVTSHAEADALPPGTYDALAQAWSDQMVALRALSPDPFGATILDVSGPVFLVVEGPPRTASVGDARVEPRESGVPGGTVWSARVPDTLLVLVWAERAGYPAMVDAVHTAVVQVAQNERSHWHSRDGLEQLRDRLVARLPERLEPAARPAIRHDLEFLRLEMAEHEAMVRIQPHQFGSVQALPWPARQALLERAEAQVVEAVRANQVDEVALDAAERLIVERERRYDDEAAQKDLQASLTLAVVGLLAGVVLTVPGAVEATPGAWRRTRAGWNWLQDRFRDGKT